MFYITIQQNDLNQLLTVVLGMVVIYSIKLFIDKKSLEYDLKLQKDRLKMIKKSYKEIKNSCVNY